jgi:predicted RNA binding protein YcfA (HicA-like mRNA interferase family)
MRVPRDINAADLIKLLEKYGYIVVKQTGSHIKMTKKTDGSEHTITVPNHKPVKIGTLQSIAKDICNFNNLDINGFYRKL